MRFPLLNRWKTWVFIGKTSLARQLFTRPCKHCVFISFSELLKYSLFRSVRSACHWMALSTIRWTAFLEKGFCCRDQSVRFIYLARTWFGAWEYMKSVFEPTEKRKENKHVSLMNVGKPFMRSNRPYRSD